LDIYFSFLERDLLDSEVSLQDLPEVEPDFFCTKKEGIALNSYVMDKECPIPEPFTANIGPILFIAALFLLNFLGRLIFAPLMPTIEQELGLTHSQAGSLFLMISLGFFVAQICSGFISSRINHKMTLVLSILGVGLAQLLFSVTSFLLIIRGLLFMLGMAAGLHMPSAIATITAMVNRKDWGKALAVHQMAPPLGLVLGPLLIILLIEWLSWQTILTILGCISFAVGFVFLRFGRFGEFSGDAPRPAAVKIVITQWSFWIMVILFSLAIGGSVGIYSMLNLFLTNERGFDLTWANTLLGLSRISGLFMTFVAGWLTDRLGAKIFIFMVILSAGIATIMLGVLSGAFLVWFIFLQPAIIGCYFAAGFAAIARMVQPNLRSIATAFITPTAFLIGGGLIPTAIGFMGEVHSFGLGIVVIGSLLVLASGLVFFINLIETIEEGC